MGVELATTQFQICQQANGQFCHISTPFQLLANLPMCIAALDTKSKVGIASKCSLQLCKTTTTTLPTQITPDVWILTTPATAPLNTVTFDMSRETHGNDPNLATNPHTKAAHGLQCHFVTFYLPPRYETPTLDVNVSLNMVNLQMINISVQCFHIWQHLGTSKVTCSYSTWQPYPQFQFTRFINISSIAPCQLYLLILIHQKIQIPSGVYSPIQEYMFQL